MLQTRLALALDHERKSLHAAAGRIEFLLSVPSGPGLGVLILGVVRYASSPDQQEEFFDRLMARDRAVLHGVDSRAAAVRLVARLLLEMGRPADAHDLLLEVIAAPRGAPDREAAWLLGRAALQLDQKGTADSMLALAGDFGKDAIPSFEPAPFVGFSDAVTVTPGSTESNKRRAATHSPCDSGRP